MSNNSQLRGTPFSATAGSVILATATVTGATGVTFYVTDIHASGDSPSGTVVIKDASTIVWQGRMGSGGWLDSDFVTPIKITTGNTLTLVGTGSAVINVNVSGYSLP